VARSDPARPAPARRLAPGLARGQDGQPRCAWCVGSPEYVRYHDEEWGWPSADEVPLFEKLCLEGFQAGLSWLTILRKRPAFRAAFAGFEPAKLARFGARDVARLLADEGIVRHRGKIEAAIENAKALQALHAGGETLAALVWRHAPAPASRPRRLTLAAARALTATPESKALSKALQQRGFRFVGPTTVYAFMQAKGLVDDHLEGCCARPWVERAREVFRAPNP